MLRTHQSLSYTNTRSTRSATNGDMDVKGARSTADSRHATPQRAEEEFHPHTPLSSRSRCSASSPPLSTSPDRPHKTPRPLDTSAPPSTCGNVDAQAFTRPRYIPRSSHRQSSSSSTTPRSTASNKFRAPERRDDVFGSASPCKSSRSTEYANDVHTDSQRSSGSSTLLPADETRGEWRRSGKPCLSLLNNLLLNIGIIDLVGLFGYESEPDDGRYAKKAWYAVVRGQGHTGIYNSWYV